MNLIVDIGNTIAKVVAFDGHEPVDELITSNTNLSELGEFATRYAFTHGIYSSVINLSHEADVAFKSLKIPMLHLQGDTPVPLQVSYRTPQTLGTDRLAAAVGASSLRPGSDILVIDAGTCLTYELIEAGHSYIGGNISPGLNMRLRSLHEHTARLPLVEAHGHLPTIGEDTETAIRAGVIRGMQYEIEGYIRVWREKYPKLSTFLTGGDLFDFDNRIKSVIFADKFLVPRGLNSILNYNNDKRK